MSSNTKNKIFIISIVLMTVMLLSTLQINIIAEDSFSKDTSVNSSETTAADFQVAAGTTDLVINTPIVLKTTDFPLPYSKLATAVIYDGAVALPTQADDLNGDGVVDEIVFQLQADILATNSKTFTLKVSNDGLNNGQTPAAIDLTIGDYNETYMDFLPASMTGNFNNGTHNAPAVDEVGEVAVK
ncbi:MAG: DUF4861 family protein [Candidatus Kariarchaeaceae archaeon]